MTRFEMEDRRLLAAADVLRGVTPAALARAYKVTPTTASRWAKVVRSGGTRSLKMRIATGRPRRLTPDQLLSLRYFGLDDKLSYAAIRDIVKVRFGVDLHEDSVGRILCGMGIRRKRGRKIQ